MITGKNNAVYFLPSRSAENKTEKMSLYSDRTDQNESFYIRKFRK